MNSLSCFTSYYPSRLFYNITFTIFLGQENNDCSMQEISKVVIPGDNIPPVKKRIKKKPPLSELLKIDTNNTATSESSNFGKLIIIC